MKILINYLTIALTVFIIFLSTGCKNTQPLKVGFVGGLTGRHSDLGVSARNGVILAAEQMNKSGGINGRPVMLITKDDRQDPEVAVKVDKELIEEGAIAIIGHLTSAMSVAAVPQINKEKIVMISPTTATTELTGIDDYFLRVLSPSKSAIDKFSVYAHKTLGLRKLIVLYDLSNEAFSREWYEYFRANYKDIGSGEVIPETFTSGSDIKFAALAQRLLDKSPDGILIAANAIDAAVVCQQLKKLGSNIPILSSMWAMTEDFIQNAGPSAEGTVFIHWYYKDFKSEPARKFRKDFKLRFGNQPNFANHFGYEAAQVLFTSLSINDNPSELRNTIIKQGIFEGIQGEMKIDKYGDPERKVFLMTVRDGQYVVME